MFVTSIEFGEQLSKLKPAYHSKLFDVASLSSVKV